MDSRINLDIEVDIDDIEGSEDNQGVADSQNNHVDHMAAYRVVDTDQEAVDNLGDLDNLKLTFLDLIIIARNNLEDDSQDVRDAPVVDIRADHFDVQVHPVYLVVMLVHLTLVIARTTSL